MLQFPKVLPFYPIHANALYLNNFGGALVVYMWMKGAPKIVHDHIYRTFIDNRCARYFVTSTKCNEGKLKEDGLKYWGQIKGSHSQCKGTMAIYIYSKVNEKKISSLNDLLPTVTSMQVRCAFELGQKFYNFKPKKKEESIKELIKRIKEVEE